MMCVPAVGHGRGGCWLCDRATGIVCRGNTKSADVTQSAKLVRARGQLTEAAALSALDRQRDGY